MGRSIHYKVWAVGMVLLVAGCKVQQPAKEYPDQYFTIQLYSFGTGIEQEAQNIVVNTIQSYQKKGYDISYSTSAWGREGEVDYCFQLQKLDPKVYKDFYNEMVNLLKDRRVHIKEKENCTIVNPN